MSGETPRTTDQKAKPKQLMEGIDKESIKVVLYTGMAGGIAGCSAKTLIAPLDRVKILFQTNNPDFKKYSSSLFGLSKAMRKIYANDGFVGFFQGHSVTLLRIFPYAAIKFITYEQIRHLLIPTDAYETNARRLLAGSLSGITSVFFTYPLDLIRVRLAFDTHRYHKLSKNENSWAKLKQRTTLVSIIRNILKEPTRFSSLCERNRLFGSINKNIIGLSNFYRGFSSTILGMIPYAGVSFWTHDFVHDIFRSKICAKYTIDPEYLTKNNNLNSHGTRPPLKTWAQLIAGGFAGMVSQTAAYPFEVIRRRLQVGAVTDHGHYHSIADMAKIIYKERGFKGFYVGLSIGYIKVIPMVACSFLVYERLKYLFGV